MEGAADAVPEPFVRIASEMGPIERSVLLDHKASSVDVQGLLRELECDHRSLYSWVGASVGHSEAVLTPAECAALRGAVESSAIAAQQSAEANREIDGAMEWQLNLSPERLDELVGAGAVERLRAFAWRHFERCRPAPLTPHVGGGDSATEQSRRTPPLPCVVWAYIRRDSAATRPWFYFHHDATRVTVNVALSDDSEHQGGRLLDIVDAGQGARAEPQLRVLERKLGSAVVHGCQVPHAVTRMLRGVRYALVLFFGRPCPKPEIDWTGVAHARHQMVLCAPSTLQRIYDRHASGHYHCDSCCRNVEEAGDAGAWFHCAEGCEYDLCPPCYRLKRRLRHFALERRSKRRAVAIDDASGESDPSS